MLNFDFGQVGSKTIIDKHLYPPSVKLQLVTVYCYPLTLKLFIVRCHETKAIPRALIGANPGLNVNPGLNFNPGFFFFCSKDFPQIIFSILFGPSNNQTVDKENKTDFVF